METINEAITQVHRGPNGVIAIGDPATGEAAAYMLTPLAYLKLTGAEVVIGDGPQRKTRGQRKAAARKREQTEKRLAAEQRRGRYLEHERNRQNKLSRKMGNPLRVYTPNTAATAGRMLRWSR